MNDLALAHTLDSPAVTITGGESIPTVSVNPINDATDWGWDGTHLVLNLTVAAPGDFSNYTLTILQKTSWPAAVARLDPFFASSVFSFKARCPSDLDCQAAPVVCPAPPSDAPPIDYLAKDFLSFRQALLDFSALRYPEWQERSEADFGVMFLEALSALADDLSYTQDRIAAEASLENATQRRSVVRMARLVDYEPQSRPWRRPCCSSSTSPAGIIEPARRSGRHGPGSRRHPDSVRDGRLACGPAGQPVTASRLAADGEPGLEPRGHLPLLVR